MEDNSSAAGAAPIDPAAVPLVELLRETTRDMAHECTAPPVLWNELSNACLDAAEVIEELHATLRGIVEIVDAAGLLNLSNGVQLGQTSWYVKAVDRFDRARAALSKAGV